METSPPKTLEDFPKFVVTALRRGTTAEAGYTHFEIEGSFDRAVEDISLHWFWLLFGSRGSLCAGVQSFDKQTRAAVLTFETTDEPDIVGHKIAYLSPYWQAYHVWMILDEDSRWEKTTFSAIDAVSESFTANDGQHYRKLSKKNEGEGLSAGTQIVSGGWDHEHCELCNKHIDAGDRAYKNRENLWVCVNCFEKYFSRKNLSFVDEL
jgi:hypothetical protein